MPEAQATTTKTRILNFLKQNGESDAKRMAGFCGLTAMAVRRHLLGLRADGMVRVRIEPRPQGRPVSVFSLTELGEAQFPRAYAALAADLLAGLVQIDGEAKVREIFRRRRASLASRYGPRVKGKTLESRVREAAAILTESGYMAQTSSSGEGEYLLTEHNCAIADVARSFPAICEQEACLIRDLVDGKVTRVSHALAGDRCCSYRIQEGERDTEATSSGV